MREFSLSALNRRPGEIADQAMIEPVMLRKHGRPQVVMMSAEYYEKLMGQRISTEAKSPAEKVSVWSGMRFRGGASADEGDY
nr:type II toxin-antitoxin system prevent-host-death family antitoxin [uncultured Devosia sp.]